MAMYTHTHTHTHTHIHTHKGTKVVAVSTSLYLPGLLSGISSGRGQRSQFLRTQAAVGAHQ